MTLTKQLLSDSRNERVEGRFICDGGVIQLFDSDPFISADDPVMTVDEWFGKWLAESCINLKISTIALYREYMDNHVIPYFAGMRLDEVNDAVIQDFINLKSDLSPATVRSLATFLKSGFKAAWERDIIEPLTWRVTLPKKTKKHLRVFSKTEQKALEDAVRASSNPNYIGILICLYTGLRVGELCALRWEDINFMNGTLTVNRTIKRIKDIKKDNGTKLVILSPKSAASQRTIPIPAFFLDELRGYKERIGANSGYVLNKDGEPVEPRTYQYQFERILKDTGIEKAKFHTLRHTFSTRALEIGFDIKTLSEILGHSSADTTLKMYAHSLDEHKRYSMNLLQNIYSD